MNKKGDILYIRNNLYNIENTVGIRPEMVDYEGMICFITDVYVRDSNFLIDIDDNESYWDEYITKMYSTVLE